MSGGKSLNFSLSARKDIERLRDFIASYSPASAARAIDRITEGLSLLRHTPEAGVALGQGYHQLILKYGKSGYVVRYRISGDTILITRIWHGREDRRNPPP
jgi:toxin ParE1/3/4